MSENGYVTSYDETRENIVYEAIMKEYKDMASWYDWFWKSYTTATLREPLNQVLSDINLTNVLVDVASGTGEFLKTLNDTLLSNNNTNRTWIGIEPSQQMLKQAEKKFSSCADNKNVKFKLSPAEEIPLPDSFANCVVCTNAFHFFRNKDQALKEMSRILKDDGKIVITDWCNDYWIVKMYHFMECLRWNWRYKDKYPGPLTKLELFDKVQSAGFDSLTLSTYRVKVFSIFSWGMQTITATKKGISLKNA